MSLSTTQRTVLTILSAVLLVSLAAASLAIAKWGFTRSNGADLGRGITVIDSAQVKVQPDTAFVEFGCINKNKNAKSCGIVNASKTEAIIAAIEKAGIAKSDIRTIDYSLSPEMNWEKNPPTIVGYTVSNTIRVRTKDMSKIGDLMDAAISAGANNVQNVKFDVEDKRKLRQRALSLAVKKAESKADAIAKALGCKLGPATTASETVDVYVPDSRNYEMKASSSVSSTPIEPGETTVSAQVKVVYSLR